jgi:hypothetical protein
MLHRDLAKTAHPRKLMILSWEEIEEDEMSQIHHKQKKSYKDGGSDDWCNTKWGERCTAEIRKREARIRKRRCDF